MEEWKEGKDGNKIGTAQDENEKIDFLSFPHFLPFTSFPHVSRFTFHVSRFTFHISYT